VNEKQNLSYDQRPIDPDSRECDLGIEPKDFLFTDLPEMRMKDRPTFVGQDALNLHSSEEYVVRHPIRFGNLNVSESYPLQSCLDDLEEIITQSIEKEMKLPRENFKFFNCILVIPDSFVKIHIRCIMTMLYKLGFKAMFIHLESIMATYAMALPTAVVVDIGSSKTQVCCIEEGIIIQKSVIRKNYGGDDMTDLLLHLL